MRLLHSELLAALCFLFDNPARFSLSFTSFNLTKTQPLNWLNSVVVVVMLRVFPWWVFGFMGCLVLALATVIFIVKDFSLRSVLSCLRTTFSLGIVMSEEDDEEENPHMNRFRGLHAQQSMDYCRS
jgi:hypothetical protein